MKQGKNWKPKIAVSPCYSKEVNRVLSIQSYCIDRNLTRICIKQRYSCWRKSPNIPIT
ncbi:hypothetical protein MKW98_031236, partial [Papaver atlanticum]